MPCGCTRRGNFDSFIKFQKKKRKFPGKRVQVQERNEEMMKMTLPRNQPTCPMDIKEMRKKKERSTYRASFTLYLTDIITGDNET